MPGPEQIVMEMNRLVSQRLAGDLMQGTYATRCDRAERRGRADKMGQGVGGPPRLASYDVSAPLTGCGLSCPYGDPFTVEDPWARVTPKRHPPNRQQPISG